MKVNVERIVLSVVGRINHSDYVSKMFEISLLHNSILKKEESYCLK